MEFEINHAWLSLCRFERTVAFIMGMTNEQFKVFLMSLIADLKRALKESPDNDELKELLSRYEEALKTV